MDYFSFVILIFLIIILAQYNLNLFSAISIFIYTIFQKSYWNILLLLVFIVVLFLNDALSNMYLMIIATIFVIILLLKLFSKKSESNSEQMPDFSKLFGDQ